jgi:hypothetical protein
MDSYFSQHKGKIKRVNLFLKKKVKKIYFKKNSGTVL